MKRAELNGSLFAVLIGLVSIYFGLLTDSGYWTILIVASAYFIGTFCVFFLSLSEDAKVDLATLETSYGRRYWLPLVSGAIVSIIIGGLYSWVSNPTIPSVILVGLGAMAILTAFVSPDYNEKTRLDNAEEFG